MSEENMGAFADKILLATDGSPEAERATSMAVTLSNGLGSELHVVRVMDAPSAYAYAYSAEAEMVGNEFQTARLHAEENVRGKLDEEAEKVRAMGGKVAGSHTGSGSAAAEISRLAEELGAGLVVLGSRGFGPLKRAVMGSVSVSVVRHAHCSVLVVRDGREQASLPEKILVAVDSSGESQEAANWILEVVSVVGAELHLVYAVPTIPSVTYPGTVITEGAETTSEHVRNRAQAVLDEEAERLESRGGIVTDTHLVAGGRPDDAIVGAAEELGAGLLVVGSRGFGGVRRALMGSVSDSVVRHAHCPVLVVRGGDRQQHAVGLAAGERGRT